MDTSGVKHALPVTTDHATRIVPVGYERRFEMRSATGQMRLERLYGAQEVVLELAILIIVLGIAFAVCFLRQRVST